MFIASNFTAILIALRSTMTDNSNNIQAYIVPSGDPHYTEFIAECHERRAYISGFTGSAGTAIVTADKALLWTDGRYYLQAQKQLPDFWTLMKDGQPETPSQSKWLKENLRQGSRVGVDPTLYSKRQWDSMNNELKSVGITLVGIEKNLVDEIWKDKPACGSNEIFNHGLLFAGKSTQEKLENVRTDMKENGAVVLVLTELDEVAWLLNLRGSDIPYSSLFFAYIIVTDNEFHFFVDPDQLNQSINSTLKDNIPEIKFNDYNAIIGVLRAIVVATTTGKVWYSPNTNYALVKVIEENNVIPDTRQIVKLSPISLMKAVKNPTEVSGYKMHFYGTLLLFQSF